ncbi:AAA family ATPase [Streptomyces pratensis]|uniref:AAA family ATPase n=1 Tax=Streptomyces pratensis TaxID=1169025 RepID=UPI00362771A7
MRVLYGREKSLQDLLNPAHSVVVITGDAGVGKSSLLSACQDTAHESHLATVGIPRLPHRTGGLQVSILAQLISITTQLVDEQGAASHLGQKVATRARAVIGPRRKDFALAVAKELLAVVKERVGSDTGQALGEFFASVSTDNSESTLEVLHNQVDSDALQAIVDIADEVAGLNEGSTLYLFFENAQNLSDEDLRQLADLPNMLSDRVVLRLEHKDSSDVHRRRIQLLRSAGVIEVPLRGLTEEVVRFWCRTKGVPESLHKRIYSSTNGYPLFVGDAIAQVIKDRRLSDTSPAENFRVSTVDSLNDLDPESAAAARQLSAFIDPPNQENIASILGEGMTPVHWEGVRSRLERARIFTTSADGTPWFHEVRRRCIWESLSPPLRREIADRAVTFIRAEFASKQDPELLVNLALIATDSSAVKEDAHAEYIIEASLDDLALMSSLLELAEAKEESAPEIPSAYGDPVFDYCRQAFMADADTFTALQRLTAAGIIFVAEDGNTAVLIPRVSELAFLLIVGRAGIELPRFPIPRIASAMFRAAIRHRLHDFVTCSFGVGRPKLLTAIRNGETSYRAVRPQHPFGRTVHGLFLRATFEGQPFYAYATFPDATTTELSTQELAEAGGRYWGLRIDIDSLLQIPAGSIRSRRFINAFERIKFTPHPAQSFTHEISKKADLLRYVRASCNPLERAVLGLEETTRYLVLEKEQQRDAMVVEVNGGGDGVEQLEAAVHRDYKFTGPYKWANLKRMLNLQIGESSNNITFGTTGSTFHEPKRILEDLSNKAREYNRTQPKLVISTSVAALQNALTISQREIYHDAQALQAVLSQYGEAILTPTKTLLLIYTNGEEGKYFGWQHAEAVYLEIPTPGLGKDSIIVKIAECEDANFDTELFAIHFSKELAEIPEVADGTRDWRRFLGVADPHYLLSKRLGYDGSESSVTFRP